MMMDTLPFFLYTFVTILAIVSPLWVIIVFIPLTSSMTVDEKHRVAKKSITLACMVALFFAISGNMILEMFGIHIDSLRVAGGILLLKIAFDMMFAHVSGESVTDKEIAVSSNKEEIWVSPLAVPMMTGPATITTVVILFASAELMLHKVIVLISILLTYSICFVALYFSRRVYNRIGYTGSLVATRLMGMFLAALAVEFVTIGIWNIYAGLI
ncbi:MAG: NAAT family transporter [Euryarchaeota archaeon]|nr:NAAT family transporter [Euryarchaeota archaeon]